MTLQMLGVFSEYERAKIIERTTRGRLHKLRMGEMSSNGHRIYGYTYVKKTPTAPATLAVNEEQAAIVREIFEMFASGSYGLVSISRYLEERRIPTSTGRPQWDRGQIKFMLKNETYTGRRYFNRITAVTDANREGKQVIRGKWVFRDRAEWIPVNVPAIVSRELFDKVQERLALHDKRYCTPDHALPPAGPRSMRRVRKRLFIVATILQGRPALGEGVRVSSGCVPLQSPGARKHARQNADRAVQQFPNWHSYP
jgi:site-specific DNA recombinase